MKDQIKIIEAASILANRLERLSADSIWARRSSGMRGSLLKFLEQVEQGNKDVDGAPRLTESQISHLQSLLQRGYFMLENAAREIPEHK